MPEMLQVLDAAGKAAKLPADLTADDLKRDVPRDARHAAVRRRAG